MPLSERPGMDRADLMDVAPHYGVLIVLMFATLLIMQSVFGDLSFWIELAVLFVIAFAYRPVVVRLGVAPEAWEQSYRDRIEELEQEHEEEP